VSVCLYKILLLYYCLKYTCFLIKITAVFFFSLYKLLANSSCFFSSKIQLFDTCTKNEICKLTVFFLRFQNTGIKIQVYNFSAKTMCVKFYRLKIQVSLLLKTHANADILGANIFFIWIILMYFWQKLCAFVST
jgi:hypothetical protein